MRWSLIASGFIVCGLLRFALGHPDNRTPTLAEPAPVSWDAPGQAPPPVPAKTPTSATTDGPSILSLLEIGPAEVTQTPVPAATQPAAEPASAPGDPAVPTVVVDVRRTRTRQDRVVMRSLFHTLNTVMETCGKKQTDRNPRLLGRVEVEIAVKAYPNSELGVLDSVKVDTEKLYIPLFETCVRIALSAAPLARPATDVRLGVAMTLEPDTSEEEEDAAEEAEKTEVSPPRQRAEDPGRS